MGLETKRSLANKFLKPTAKKMKFMSPNSASLLSIIFAAFAGYFFYTGDPFLVLSAGFFVFLNGLFDALDGALARIQKKASKKGDFIDHVLDRYADVFILLGLTFSPLVRNWIGFLAIIGVLLTSYMGTQAMALTKKRLYAGFLSRATRLVILIFSPVIHYLLIYLGISIPYLFSFMELVLIYFAVAGNLTALERIYKTWQML
ncbi:MAG: CDP-alcohol phosphatidyltransferase family protein [Candidatus Undinarchaeales archaeon]